METEAVTTRKVETVQQLDDRVKGVERSTLQEEIRSSKRVTRDGKCQPIGL